MARTNPDRAPPFLRHSALAAFLVLAACGGHDQPVPGDANDHRPWQGIAANEAIQFVGTEPFWGGHVEDGSLTYTTPESPDGETISVSRFAGRGGLSFSGDMAGASLVLAITPGKCSDTMSDRTFPFVATLQIGDETRRGCAWSTAHPFEGGEG